MQPALLHTAPTATPRRIFGSRSAIARMLGRHTSGASKILTGLTAQDLAVKAPSPMICDDCCSCCPDRTGHRAVAVAAQHLVYLLD